MEITDTERLEFVFEFVHRRDLWNALMDRLICDESQTCRQIIDDNIKSRRKSSAK